MLVLSRHGMGDSTNVVLVALSLSDLIFSTSETFSRSVRIVNRYDLAWADALSTIQFIGFVRVSLWAMVTSTWLVSVISVERMLAVCFPFHVSRLTSPKKMTCTVVLVYIFVTPLYYPYLGHFYATWDYDPVLNKTYLYLYMTQWYYDNYWWLTVHERYILPSFATTIPMVAILVGTFTTIVALTTQTAQHKRVLNTSSLRARRAKEMKSVKISLLICLCLAFSILIPNAALDAWIGLNIHAVPLVILDMIRDFTQLAVQLNASMNFFIYVALSSKFKETY
ncbi:unnamed protein product, partial [Lymnaea stagnalis]